MKSRRHSSATNLVGRVCTIAILLGGVPHVVLAQSLASVAAASARPVTGESRTTSEPPSNALYLLVGRSTVVDIDGAIARVSLSKPDIADALITSSQQLLVHGKAPGTISLLVWERNGALRRFEVDVQRDLTSLKEQMQRLFPGEPIAVSVSGKHIVIAGNVSSPYVIEKAAAVAAGYVDKADDVVNLLRQQQGVVSNQVLLRVRFAEVSRNALTELGASFFTGSGGYKDYVARSTTQQFSAPDFDSQKGGLVFSDFLNLLLFNTKQQIGTLVRALQNKGLFQTLAEPNLVAESGKEASFLAGGEYPYPVAQSSGSNLAIAIHFKEFGIKLNFTPTILGNDLVHLKVRPEVSSLDFGNAVSLEGFRIPALTTRRTETEIELRDGQTFAIAGLLNNTVTSSLQKIPGIGDIPVLGLLFRSKAAQKAQTELVVMITPEILRRDAAGAASGLPGLAEPFLPPPSKIIPPPMPQTPGAPRPKEPAKEESKNVGVTQPESAATPTPVIVHVPETSAAVPASEKSDVSRPKAEATAPATEIQSATPLTVVPAVMPAVVPAVMPPKESATPPMPAPAMMPAAAAPAAVPTPERPTGDVRKRLAMARKQRDAEIEAAGAERKRAAKAQKEQEAREAEAKRAAEQAQKKQQEAAKKAAAVEAKRAAEASKQAAEDAKKNEELARKQQKALNEAEARLKQAEAVYQKAALQGTTKR